MDLHWGLSPCQWARGQRLHGLVRHLAWIERSVGVRGVERDMHFEKEEAGLGGFILRAKTRSATEHPELRPVHTLH